VRIGLVTDFYSPWIGGPAALVQNLSRGLAGRGHDVSVLAPSATGWGGREQDGDVEVVRVPTLPVPFGYRVRVSVPLGLTRWLDAFRPDVIHVHHPFPLSAAAVFAAPRHGIPVAATNHTIPSCSLWGLRGQPVVHVPAARMLGRWIVHLLDRCVAVATPTETAATMLRDMGFHRRVSVISNGVNTQRFQPGQSPALRQRFGLDERPVVLYTGRLDAEKDMEVWIRAAAAVGGRVAQYVVGGEGADRPRLERLARDLGLDSIRFIGYVEEALLPDLYRMADVYFIVAPVELQSISTLEALASGLPVVAVDAGALPELVQDGKNGLLVPAGSVAVAAEALEALVTDTRRRSSMGKEARRVAQSHDVFQMVAAYDGLLRDVAAQPGAGSDRAAAGRR